MRAEEDPQTSLVILSAVDTAKGLPMVTVVPAKGAIPFADAERKRFVLETGRTHGILHCDAEPSIKDLVSTFARELGGLSVRTSPVASSQSLGSAERFHAKLFGQVRVLRKQLQEAYGHAVPTGHFIVPWLVRHAAWLLGRYRLHADGLSSFQRCWGRPYDAGLCQLGETVFFRLVGSQVAKLSSVWEPGLWLGRTTESGEVLVATPDSVFKARSVRRLPLHEKFDKELFDKACGVPWAPRAFGEFDPDFVLPPGPVEEQEASQPSGSFPPSTPAASQPGEPAASGDSPASPRPVASPEPDPMEEVFGELWQPWDPASPEQRRLRQEQGQSSPQRGEEEQAVKQLRLSTSRDSQDSDNPEPLCKRPRVAATVLPSGKDPQIHVNEDKDIFEEPIIFENLEDFPEQLLKYAMAKELASMRSKEVLEEVSLGDLSSDDRASVLTSRWVHRRRGEELRSRLVVRGFDQFVDDKDSVYASTPVLISLRVSVVLVLSARWSIYAGDVSTAFLHTSLPEDSPIFVYPPKEFYPSMQTFWKL
jgi:hypothetical protein